jgi:hypothetical protein
MPPRRRLLHGEGAPEALGIDDVMESLVEGGPILVDPELDLHGKTSAATPSVTTVRLCGT